VPGWVGGWVFLSRLICGDGRSLDHPTRCAKLLNYRPTLSFKSFKPIESNQRLPKAKERATENWIGLSSGGAAATGSKAKLISSALEGRRARQRQLSTNEIE